MKTKKILFSVLTFVSLFILVQLFIVKPVAYDGIDSTGTTTWNISEETITDNWGVHYSQAVGNHKTGSAESLDRLVNYFEMKTDGVNSKLATWAYIGNNYQASVAPLSEIAKDYEKHHPGWIVVSGINADQWYYGTTQNDAKGGYFYYKNQTYYPFTMDGQNMFTISPLGTSGNGIAITNNPENPIVETSGSVSIELQIYDEKNTLIATYPVSGYNQTPNENATTIWSGRLSESVLGDFITKDVASNNDLYIIEKAEMAYMNNSREYPSAGVYAPVDSFYGRGIISIVSQNWTLKKGQFAIETTNEELKTILKTGVKVIVEQQYAQEEANQAESVTGYHTMHMKNGIVNEEGSNSYNNSDRPRSIFGIKEDGTYFLLTIRNTPKTGGPNYNETNAILNYYGAYTAFQDDGGGSVTAIYRNDKGGFDNVSPSTDNRSIFSGLFFVVRDPLFEINNNQTTPETITLELKENEYTTTAQEIQVKANGKQYQVENNQVKIKGLEENTEYKIEVTYKIGEEEYQTQLYGKTKTYDPGIDINPTSKGFKIGLRQTDENLITSKITMKIEEETYIIENKEGQIKEYNISDYYKGETYRISYTYEVTIKETKETYTREVGEKEYSTLSYEIPEITTFTVEQKRGKINIGYDYEDKDELITEMYIQDGTTKIEIEKGSYSYSIEDDKKEHHIQLILVYETPEGMMRMVKSNIVEIEHTHEWKEADCTTPKTCTICGQTEGEALGHEISEWKIETEASCTSEGKRYKECTRCGEKIEEETIAKKEHEWKEADCTTPKTCTICGQTEGEALGHEISEWKIETEASCTSEGKRYKECTRCGEKIEEETIAKKEHEWEEATTERPKTCTICGETEGEKLVEEKKKGCKKSAISIILSSIVVVCTSIYIIRKKR